MGKGSIRQTYSIYEIHDKVDLQKVKVSIGIYFLSFYEAVFCTLKIKQLFLKLILLLWFV